MLYIVKMPKLSPTMEEGSIIKWRKQVGDYVNANEILFEVSTDKSVIEYPNLDEGWLREILVKENEKITIGFPVAVISSEKNEPINRDLLLQFPEKRVSSEKSLQNADDDAVHFVVSEETNTIVSSVTSRSSVAFKPASFAPEPPLPHLVRQNISRQNISPLAKSIAEENNLDLSVIQGSGPGGRIVEKDLYKAPKKSVAGFGRTPEFSKEPPGSYKETSLSPVRAIIAERLQASKNSIPHFYLRQEINAQKLMDLKNQLATMEIKLSYNDFITKACAFTLKEFPNINSGFNGKNNTVVLFSTIDISFAVALKDGLVTPIIRHADKKNIGDISIETKELAKKAKNNKLKDYEYKGGSFCISNLGMTHIQEFSAIINPPQSAILAVGGIISKPVVENNQVVPGYTMTLTLSLDHRVIDGQEGALFMKRLQTFLENPAILLLN